MEGMVCWHMNVNTVIPISWNINTKNKIRIGQGLINGRDDLLTLVNHLLIL